MCICGTYVEVIRSERDHRGVPHISDSHQQLQRRVASWSGDSQADEGRRQRGPEGHWSSHLRPVSTVYQTIHVPCICTKRLQAETCTCYLHTALSVASLLFWHALMTESGINHYFHETIIMVKVFISNCYVSNHILHSECRPLADTLTSNGFLQQGSSDPLQCVL